MSLRFSVRAKSRFREVAVAMEPDQQRLTPTERANLVAYLDGELNEAESRALATKLTQSATARRDLEALQKTWDLLDLLPRPRASDDFTQRTLTQIDRLQLPGDRFVSAAAKTINRAGILLAWTVASAACFLFGVVSTNKLWPDRTSRLARDLNIAEHLDEYRDVGTIEFLDRLDKLPEFADDPN